jgi:hypothetical protein
LGEVARVGAEMSDRWLISQPPAYNILRPLSVPLTLLTDPVVVNPVNPVLAVPQQLLAELKYAYSTVPASCRWATARWDKAKGEMMKYVQSGHLLFRKSYVLKTRGWIL